MIYLPETPRGESSQEVKKTLGKAASLPASKERFKELLSITSLAEDHSHHNTHAYFSFIKRKMAETCQELLRKVKSVSRKTPSPHKEPLQETPFSASKTSTSSLPSPTLSQSLSVAAVQDSAPASIASLNLPPHLLDLLGWMEGVMTTMHLSGISETTFTLDSSLFASSALYGTKIVIQEYSTAPKAFNIQLQGLPAAVDLLNKNLPGLMQALQQGHYDFQVHRLETHLLTEEKPLVTRKEHPSEEKGNDSQ